MTEPVSDALKAALVSQFGAALDMLESAVTRCPAALWAAAPTNAFWHVAYHALFYVQLYLQPTEADLVPWDKRRPNLNFLGPLPWPPHERPAIGEPYTKEDVLGYLALCRRELHAQTASVDFDAPSGFDWITRMGKLELQLYSLRHLQHHVGELSTMLLLHDGTEVDWVGLKRS